MRHHQLILALGLTFAFATQLPPTRHARAQNIADLQQQLQSGLKARQPREFAFIRRVVTLVNNQQLSVDLVKSTMQWARRKAGLRKYPFPYFEFAMRELAKKRGVEL